MSANQDQIDFWNGEAGKRWVEQNRVMEVLLKPIGSYTLDGAAPQPGETALDIGCGCGNQTLDLARRIGSGGSVLGVDVSEPMLALAREQAQADTSVRAPVAFLHADASVHRFQPGRVDLLFSRFGVMFFDDPVAAFANLRTALRPGGRVAFCCWQAFEVNDFMRIPYAAALPLFAPPQPLPAGAPGPFAFAEPEHVQQLLQAAGYEQIRIDAFEQPMHYGENQPLEESARRLMDLGPVSRLLAGAPEATVAEALKRVIAALRPHADASGLHLMGRCWLVRARNA